MGSQLPLKGAQPQFSVHVNCGQMAGWMKTPLGADVDLGPGHIVLDRVPAPHPAKGAQQPPLFGPCPVWPRSPISATAELLFDNVLCLPIVSERELMFTFAICYRPSVCLSSVCLSVCNVRAPYSGGSNFGNISKALGTLPTH